MYDIHDAFVLGGAEHAFSLVKKILSKKINKIEFYLECHTIKQLMYDIYDAFVSKRAQLSI